MAAYFVNRLKSWLDQQGQTLPPSDERLLRCRPSDLRNLPLGDLEYLKTLDPETFQQRYVVHILDLLQQTEEDPAAWRERLEQSRNNGNSDMSDLIVAKALTQYPGPDG